MVKSKEEKHRLKRQAKIKHQRLHPNDNNYGGKKGLPW